LPDAAELEDVGPPLLWREPKEVGRREDEGVAGPRVGRAFRALDDLGHLVRLVVDLDAATEEAALGVRDRDRAAARPDVARDDIARAPGRRVARERVEEAL